MGTMTCRICVAILIVLIGGTNSIERDVTFPIKAQTEECFFEPAVVGQILEIDYQVIDGGSGGTFAIDFSITKPDGVPAVMEQDKSDNVHQVIIDKDGDYKICFDNSRARFGSKMIFFELLLDNDGADDLNIAEFLETDDYEKVEEMGASLKIIRDRMTKSRQLQEQLRSHEFRDRSIAERNFERVNFWSLVQLGIMVIAGMAQVAMIRSIFDEKSPIRKIFK
jgi:protein ERP2